MLQDLTGKAHTSRGVTRVERTPAGPSLRFEDGSEQVFDQVVVAAHADQALAMLGDASARERALLSCFRYQWNRAVLHTDAALMPQRRAVWSSWNYLAETTRVQAEEARVSVSYWMNRLQGLPATPEFFVTLNPLEDPQEDTVIAEMGYEHPVFDHGAMAAQPRLDEIQGRNGTWFCGSYFGYGFHEDALVSAIRVARALGVTPAWQQAGEPHDATARPALVPGLQGA
jgi:predicted NAD/FAD-binding protein